MVRLKRKGAFEYAHDAQIQIILRIRKVTSGPLPSIHTFYSFNDSVSGQWMPWWDCADAQADLGIRCPHMLEKKYFRMARPLYLMLIAVIPRIQIPDWTFLFWTKIVDFYILRWSLEKPRRGACYEYQQHMFSWRNKKKISIRSLLWSYDVGITTVDIFTGGHWQVI